VHSDLHVLLPEYRVLHAVPTTRWQGSAVIFSGNMAVQQLSAEALHVWIEMQSAKIWTKKCFTP